MSDDVEAQREVLQNLENYVKGKDPDRENVSLDAVTADRHAPQTHPDLYNRVENVLDKVNAAMSTDIDVPHIVIIEDSPHAPAAYGRGDDVLILDKDSIADMSNDRLNAIIAHELGHKIGHEFGMGGHGAEAETERQRDVVDSTRAACTEEQTREFLRPLVRDPQRDPAVMGITRDDVEMNVLDKGASPECAEAVADAIERYSDGRKGQEYFGDYVAVKAGFGAGILEDVQSTVDSHFHSGIERLGTHINDEDRADHAQELIERFPQGGDSISLFDFSPENGGAVSGVMDFIGDALEILGVKQEEDHSVSVSPDESMPAIAPKSM